MQESEINHSAGPVPDRLKSVFSFPNPVNEVAARMVAGMVVVLTLAIILTDQPWLMFVLAYGFLARVATGPTLSPMGLLATRVLAPGLGIQPRPVPGPPDPAPTHRPARSAPPGPDRRAPGPAR